MCCPCSCDIFIPVSRWAALVKFSGSESKCKHRETETKKGDLLEGWGLVDGKKEKRGWEVECYKKYICQKNKLIFKTKKENLTMVNLYYSNINAFKGIQKKIIYWFMYFIFMYTNVLATTSCLGQSKFIFPFPFGKPSSDRTYFWWRHFSFLRWVASTVSPELAFQEWYLL